MQPKQWIALKEWAVAVNALQEGKQILLMRKGGIIEETRDFRLKSHSFYLFPTFEHQKKEWIKPEYQPELDKTLRDWSPSSSSVNITSFAHVVEDIEIFDSNQLERLKSYHIWTDPFAEERLKWKKKNPLHILILRVYNLSKAWEVPIIPAYIGCKSWIEMDLNPPELEYKPALEDEKFNTIYAEIKRLIAE